MRRTLAVALCLLASLAVTRGDAPPAPPDIEKLIQQLDDKEFQVRLAAEKAIEAIGPDALPALRKALAGKPSLEVSRRIEKWIPQFELAAVSDPKRITLNVKDRPLHEVIDQIAKQSGYAIAVKADMEQARKPCTFAFNRVTLWDALDAVCSAGEMIVTCDAKGIQLEVSDHHQPFVWRHGAFRVVPVRLTHVYRQQLQNQLTFPRRGAKPMENGERQPEPAELSLHMRIEVEPRLKVVGYGYPNLHEATDSDKQSLMHPPTALEKEEGAVPYFFDHPTEIYFNPPAKVGKKIAVLRGTIAVRLEKEKKRTVLADNLEAAKGKKFTYGGGTAEIVEIKKAGNEGYDLTLTLTGVDLGPRVVTAGMAVGGNPALEGPLELLDEKGNAYQMGDSKSSGSGKTTKIQIRFVAPNGMAVGPAVRLVHTERVTLDYPLPFEFRNLPLP